MTGIPPGPRLPVTRVVLASAHLDGVDLDRHPSLCAYSKSILLGNVDNRTGVT
jgi:hypothetical protein